ncbi:conserved protein of unknown function [Pseudomonas marincola]|uniref:Uncharacterized protein n=1 Tax=Pseudomonas marincola TaxID=437900 RepID=A0A653E7N7_9PSED|nr:conserved protein of unknown function [Pseudomonas marincola]
MRYKVKQRNFDKRTEDTDDEQGEEEWPDLLQIVPVETRNAARRRFISRVLEDIDPRLEKTK